MRIIFQRRFDKDYKKAPPQVQDAFQERLQLFSQNPFHPFLRNHKLFGSYLHHRSINVTGDWRAVYRPIGESEVWFTTIGTHSKLY
ncbi:MAG: type II toxin-antitoxin system mRNA interferase toxin, RelE/StbE family [Candidatus Magasanikbacteria bacterium]|nr:type II toxin-antitoxin system mRNA interferase toxin, RelE/StbE family [Candidatus Magasanikbacteria bacterium]